MRECPIYGVCSEAPLAPGFSLVLTLWLSSQELAYEDPGGATHHRHHHRAHDDSHEQTHVHHPLSASLQLSNADCFIPVQTYPGSKQTCPHTRASRSGARFRDVSAHPRFAADLPPFGRPDRSAILILRVPY